MAEASSSTAAPTVVRPENIDDQAYAAIQLYRSVCSPRLWWADV